jgi:hypothetical protein
MKVRIVTTQQQYELILRKLLPPGDSNEHFGFGISGISRYGGIINLLLREFVAADDSCLFSQSGANVRPDPRFIDYAWALAKKSKGGIIDFHTHPFSGRYVSFSGIDDRSEMDSFPKAVQYLGDGPHASIVLSTTGLDARWYNPKTKTVEPVTEVKILGEKLTVIVPTSTLKQARLSSDT